MALSPDDIERRTFALVNTGYDRDEVRKFLIEVAATLRVAHHTTQPPVSSTREPALPPVPREDVTRWPARAAGDPAPALPVSRGAAAADPFDSLGSEVADVLRAAHDSVDAIRARAELDAAERRQDAEQAAAEIRRKAETEAAAQEDRAKRILVTAKEKAEAIVAEAEAQGRAIVATATSAAEQHSRQVTERAIRQAEEALRAERDLLARLHEAHRDIGRTIDSLARVEHRPVLDLRGDDDPRRTVSTDPPGPASSGPPVPVDEAPTHDGPTAHDGDGPRHDPVLRMVRQAVDRAVEAAGGEVPTEVPAAAPGQVSAEPGDPVVVPS